MKGLAFSDLISAPRILNTDDANIASKGIDNYGLVVGTCSLRERDHIHIVKTDAIMDGIQSPSVVYDNKDP